MYVVADSPHVVRCVAAPASLDSRLRPVLPAVLLKQAQPLVVVGTQLGVTIGFHHTLSEDTNHLASLPIAEDAPRVQRAQDAQDRLQELLSQMRALQAEAQESTSGSEAGWSSLDAQLEALSAEAQDAANLVHFDDVHRMSTSSVDTVSVTRRDHDAYVRQSVSQSCIIVRDDEDRQTSERRGFLSAHEAQTKTVSVDKPQHDHVQLGVRSVEHAHELVQRLVQHFDTQGIAYVAAQNYAPVGTVLSTLYAQLEHQSVWRPSKVQAVGTTTPVAGTLGTRFI